MDSIVVLILAGLAVAAIVAVIQRVYAIAKGRIIPKWSEGFRLRLEQKRKNKENRRRATRISACAKSETGHLIHGQSQDIHANDGGFLRCFKGCGYKEKCYHTSDRGWLSQTKVVVISQSILDGESTYQELPSSIDVAICSQCATLLGIWNKCMLCDWEGAMYQTLATYPEGIYADYLKEFVDMVPKGMFIVCKDSKGCEDRTLKQGKDTILIRETIKKRLEDRFKSGVGKAAPSLEIKIDENKTRYQIGYKPGKGFYSCTNWGCNWEVVLDEDGKLPPCGRCSTRRKKNYYKKILTGA